MIILFLSVILTFLLYNNFFYLFLSLFLSLVFYFSFYTRISDLTPLILLMYITIYTCATMILTDYVCAISPELTLEWDSSSFLFYLCRFFYTFIYFSCSFQGICLYMLGIFSLWVYIYYLK